MEEDTSGLIEVILRYLHGGTEENYAISSTAGVKTAFRIVAPVSISVFSELSQCYCDERCHDGQTVGLWVETIPVRCLDLSCPG
jgi:hypothetical protein